MPELTSLQGPESYIPYGERRSTAGLPFTTGYVDLQVSGGTATLFAVSFPDATDDSLILNLINTYRPLAVPLLTQWVQQQQYPVLIDLRAPGSQHTQRADYLLQKEGAFTLPVVFLWDNYSAGRAGNYMQVLYSNPAISVSRLSGSGFTAFGKEQGNCFQIDRPVF
ncbi:hypothetical protein [Chitinophaga sp. S165]|uniref:hypothetical protein n=1 Tax=Chitinophaga sp. S165 TaxID=2135462 RepID=UPI0011B48E3B|nr:hypothetical protein [Chitinophaga sp. S165]